MPSTATDRFDGALSSKAIKAPCKAIATSNITLSGEQTVNSVAVTEGDRVLVTGQTDQTENGIHVCETGAWNRAPDFDGNRDVTDGTLVTVAKTTGMNFFYQVDTTDDPVVIGTSDIVFLAANDPNISYAITDDEISDGKTTSDINSAYPELHVLRYGSALNATTLQAAIDYWIAKDSGTLDLAGQTFDTGLTEIVANFDTTTRTNMWLNGNGAMISPSGTIDSGNGYGIKITRGALVLVRNKRFSNFKVKPTAGDCGGIEVDGRDNANGSLYNLQFDFVQVDTVTKHGFFLGGTFFESTFDQCSVRIPTNETGLHCVAIDEDGNDDAAGDISSITLNDCNLSGGENNVNLDGAGDSFKCDDGTYLLSGKESILGSTSGHLEFNVENIHFENAWNGSSAIKSGDWASDTDQAVIKTVGRGTIRDCRCVSSTDAVRQIVSVHATGAFLIEGMHAIENSSGDFAYVCRAKGIAAGKITINSCEVTGTNQVAVVDTDLAGSVNWKIRGCPDAGDSESIKTFTSADATPSVLGGNTYFSNATGVTITRFDDGVVGQELTIISKGATVYDTSSADRLIGSSVDITTASGDVTTWVCEVGGTTSSVWRLKGFVDVSVDNSAGA